MVREIPPRPRRRRASLVAIGVLLALLGLAPAIGQAGPEIRGVEAEFEAALRRVRPATVGCVPHATPLALSGFSSGVIISSDGLILSDGDAGMRWRQGGGAEGRRWLSDVDVRVPRPGGGYQTYLAQVLRRDRTSDTSLLRILRPPSEGLPYVSVGRSDDVQVGDFVFALGTAFDEESRSPPALTVGLVTSYEPRASAGPGGRYDLLYVGAAVNQGVNGGPLVDLEGRLVGTVSSYVDPSPDATYQFLGKVIPIDRIRAVHAGSATARAALAPRAGAPRGDGMAHALQTTFRAGARRAGPGVVSFEVRRARPVDARAPLQSNTVTVPRYRGPISGVVIDADGWIVTSLYNLTNVNALAEPVWNVPDGAGVDEGLADVQGATVHFADGRAAEARLVGHDPRLGVALLKADLAPLATDAGPYRAEVGAPAPATSFEPGRFVLVLGNPFGGRPRDLPMLTMGILSKRHADDVAAAWRGQWQTDAPAMDTNCGGAAVDLEGRLLGVLTIWHPARHGRSSGVAFVVPWEAIRAALPDMRAGHTAQRGFLGVSFARGRLPRVAEVVAGSAAEAAGIRVGDIVHRVGREDTATVSDVISAVGFRYGGEEVVLVVERDGALQTVPVSLGSR